MVHCFVCLFQHVHCEFPADSQPLFRGAIQLLKRKANRILNWVFTGCPTILAKLNWKVNWKFQLSNWIGPQSPATRPGAGASRTSSNRGWGRSCQPWGAIQLVCWLFYWVSFTGCITEMRFILCTWLGETSSCSFSTVLPGPAWVLLNKFCKE